MAAIRVFLADDHNLVRSGIRMVLEQAQDIEVIGETGQGAEVVTLVERLQPDVLLLDMEMPGASGVDVARQLEARGSPVCILALSAYDDEGYIRNLLASGAAGYLTKEEAPERIIEAVRGIAQGQTGWLSRRIAARLTNWAQKPSATDLTPREQDVLQLAAGGKTNQDIGDQLNISEKTVEKHLTSIYEKLNVSSRVEAAVRAVQEGLI